LLVAVLPCDEFQPPCGLVLPTNAAGIRNPSAYVQHQFKSQTRLCTDLMMITVLVDLRGRPCMPTNCLVDLLHPNSGIECSELILNCPHEQRSQILHQLVGSARRGTTLLLAGLDVFFPQRLIWQITGRLAVAIKHTSLVCLREWIKGLELGR